MKHVTLPGLTRTPMSEHQKLAWLWDAFQIARYVPEHIQITMPAMHIYRFYRRTQPSPN